MAGNASQSLTGSIVLDDGTCAAGAVPVYRSDGSIPQLAVSTPTTGLGSVVIRMPLVHGRSDTGLVLDATGGAGLFSISNTTGTSLALSSEAAKNNTKTDKVAWEFTIPNFYHSGDNLTVTVSAKHTLNSGTASVKTIAAALYLLADAGTSGATLIATAAQATTTSTADYTFVVTGTTLTPGSRVFLELTAVVTETANAGSGVVLTVNSVRLS